jgi:hypothetical protein
MNVEQQRRDEAKEGGEERPRINIPAEIEALAKAAVDAAFSVHTEVGPGLLESAYEEWTS